MTFPIEKLGGLAELDSGFAFKSKYFSEEGGIPLARIRDVVPGVSNTRYLGDYDERYLINDGDMLIGMDGEFNLAKWRGGPALLNQRVCRVRGIPGRVFDGYLYYFLPRKLKEIEAKTPSVTVKHLSAKVLRDIDVPLPPESEQRRIADILDKADAIRRKRQQTIDLADEFLRSVFLDMFGSDRQLPREPLEKVAGSIEYGYTASATERGDGPKLLRITDIQNDSVDWSKVPLCECSSQSEQKYRLERGDIVFARTGATTGKSFLIFDEPPRSVFASYLIRVRPSEQIDPVYLAEYFRSQDYWSQVSSMAQGAAQPGINGTKLKSLSVPIPSIDSQQLFRQIYTKVKSIKESQSDAVSKSDHLFSSLSQRAFKGEL